MRKLVTFQNVYKEYKVGDNIIKASNDLNRIFLEITK